MKRWIFAFLLFIALYAMNVNAQNTTLDGSPVVLGRDAKTWVLENNDDRLVFCAVSRDLAFGFDDLWIYYYNKVTQQLDAQKFDDNLEGRFAYITDGMVHLIGERTNKKTKSLDYVEGTVPASEGTVKKMSFATKYSVPFEKHELYFHQFAFSPDLSKFAILTVLNPKSKSDISHIEDVAVFSSDGDLLWHHRQNVHYRMNYNAPIMVSNDGVVYIAEYGCYENVGFKAEDSLHISVYNEHGIENITEYFGPQSSFRCAKSLLKDGRLVISGVVCRNRRSSEMLSTYFVSGDGGVELVESPIELPVSPDDCIYNGDVYHDSVNSFLPYMHEIQELPDGKLLLVGELNYRDIIGQVVSLGGPSYWIYGYLSRNLYKIVLTSGGDVVDVSTYPRATVTKEFYKWYCVVNTPGVFTHDGDLYFLYNEHKDNFTNGHQRLWTVLNNNRAGETAVVLSKVENDALDNHVLYVAKPYPMPRQPALTGDYEYFNKVLAIDNNAVYYVLRHDNEFRLEKITW